MDPGAGVCSPVARNDWRSQSAPEDLLAFAFPALRTIHPGLGFLVVGLDQRGAPRDGVRSRAGPNPVCRHAVQPAPLVAVFLVSGGANSLRSDLYHDLGDRSAVQQI